MRYGGMIKLDVLAIGNFQRDQEGKVFDAHSSSVLIRTNERTIVVDTSTSYMRPAIKTSFKQIGVFPKDVDTVVLTHSHYDHVGNNDMFENAEILVHPDEHGRIDGAKPIETDKELAPGVRIVHTPGHTKGSISVFVRADMKYAIAGDSLPKQGNYERMVPPAINIDAEVALESLKMIIRYADVIIPGHDPPFLAER
ncbi:MAG: MBL fold metallo-hydrolase [Methanomassiliicoccaceae archaeon]|nr:MBL fold metallo-hydrolase [Methanomassiliicoccaceae archaeon]